MGVKRRQADLAACASTLVKAIEQGVLITTRSGDKVNAMVAGWGTIGFIWNRPVFVAYVREDRYTRALLDENPEFTVNIPLGKVDRNVMRICGMQSGRDMDKLAAAGLTAVAPKEISVPGILEFPLTLECRVVYRDKPVDGGLPGGKRMDEHVCYYGEIVATYLIEEA